MRPNWNSLALIVEDDPELSRALAEESRNLGFRVVTACDFRSAVDVLKDHRPSLISASLELPDESGYELCEYIRGRLELLRVPILVTSERASLEDMAHAEEAGANAFLEKPFTMDRFRGYVAALIDASDPVSSPDVLRLRL